MFRDLWNITQFYAYCNWISKFGKISYLIGGAIRKGKNNNRKNFDMLLVQNKNYSALSFRFIFSNLNKKPQINVRAFSTKAARPEIKAAPLPAKQGKEIKALQTKVLNLYISISIVFICFFLYIGLLFDSTVLTNFMLIINNSLFFYYIILPLLISLSI